MRYEEAILALDARLVNEQQVRVLLIPHVLTDPAQAESDISACRDLATRLPERLSKHVAVVEECKDARELKWVISKLDWFCGTRLHATIAGLSSGVPTATLAYSMKAQGIFDDFASGDHCADMRFLNSVTAVNQVLKSYLNRDAHKSILQHARYIMLQRWVQQVNDLNGYLASPTFQQVA